MYCTKCGAQNSEETRFCTSCGQALDAARTSSETKQNGAAAPRNNRINQTHPNYYDQYQQPYPRYSQQPRVQNVYVQQSKVDFHPEEHVSVGGWIGRWFLMLIPIVNIIMLFVWAFGGSRQRSLKTWARAQLLLYAIAIGIILAVVIIAAATGANLFNGSRNYYYYY